MLLALLLLAGVANETPAPASPLVTCAKAPARSWTTVREHPKALTFIAAVKTAALEFSEGGPFDCGLKVVAQCGPDLDGDGVRDTVVRAQWGERFADDGEPDTKADEFARCHNPRFRGSNATYSSLFLLLSRDAPSAIGDVRLLEDETGAGREGPTGITFTTWNGQAALKLLLKFTYAASGRMDRKERILVVRDGRLIVVSERHLE